MNLDQTLERFEPRQLRLMLSGGLLVLVALIGSAVWPQVRDYRALRNSHTILSQASTNHDELARQMSALRAQSAELRHRLQGGMGDLPLEQVESHIIGLLQRLCWQRNLELSSVVPRPGETVNVFRETVLDVELRGDYPDFFKLLNDMRDELGFLVVKQYEITPIEADKAVPRLAAKIQIAAYRSTTP